MAVAAPPLQERSTATRLESIDILRGLVMIIMALDHTRDFFHSAAMAFPPENLARTTAAIFFTRWITHFCAPVFMFTAGIGAFLWFHRGHTKAELSRFLWTRGLWLVVLEFTVVRAGFFLNFEYNLLILSILYAIGMCMIALALLVRLPFRVLAAVSVGMIALHNLFDGVQAAKLGKLSWLWLVLHQQGVWQTGGPVILTAYPLIPWIGVMGAGFCFGRVYLLDPQRRRTLLVRLGLALTAAFLVLRAINIYGDPRPWAPQPTAVFTLLSFLNTAKYPPSLDFLLMTLGPAIAFLGWIDTVRVTGRNPFLVFGRVPLFYFLLHLPLIHVLSRLFTWLRYGTQPFLFVPPPTLGTPRNLFPPDYGWDLWVVYAVWLGVVVALYPACLWFSRLKRRRRDWWLSYL